MRKPILRAFVRQSGQIAYRVYAWKDEGGQAYVGTAESKEQAAEIHATFKATGKKAERPVNRTERRCWIQRKSDYFMLIGHDKGETKRKYLGSTKTKIEAEAARDAYVKDGTLPKPRIGDRNRARNGERKTRSFVQTPKSISAIQPNQRPAELTDERREMMRRMLNRIG